MFHTFVPVTIVHLNSSLGPLTTVGATIVAKQTGSFGEPNKTVECDETFLTKHKYHRGRRTASMSVTIFGIYCREDKKGECSRNRNIYRVDLIIESIGKILNVNEDTNDMNDRFFSSLH